MQWTKITEDQWILSERSGPILRAVNRRGPYMGQVAETFTLTGPGYVATEHATLAEAQAAAEASAEQP